MPYSHATSIHPLIALHACLRLLLATLLVIMAGCSVTPKPIADSLHKERSQKDVEKMYAAQAPLEGKITLSQATARAIRYNMDYRTRMMEQAWSLGQLDVANFDLLPKMTVSAGYTDRSNAAFGYGFGQDGKVTTNPSASQERSVMTSKSGFSWSVLDFGLSYYRARQLADQALITEERRRKAMQNLMQDVRLSFWRAYVAQQLLPEMGRLLRELEHNAFRAKIILAQRLLTPLQIISYRRSLIDLEQQLANRATELAQSRVEFAQLINLPPDQAYELEAPSMEVVLRDFVGKVEILDQLALENRPELREEGYRVRITELEKSRMQLQAIFPGISVDYSYNTSSNKYLLNGSWAAVGTEAAANLVKIFSLPAVNKSAQAQKQMDEARRMAQAAAVLAQIRIAVTRYDVLGTEYQYWQDAIEDDKRFLETLTSSANAGVETELELIRAKAKLLGTRVSAGLAYATLEGAMGRIYNSVGLDVLPREMIRNDLVSLTTELDTRIQTWERLNFSARKPLGLPAVSLAFANRVEPEVRAEIRRTVAQIFKLANIDLQPDAELVLITDVEVTGEPGSKIMGRITGQLRNQDAQVIAEIEQNSTLTYPVTAKQWSALGEAVGMKVSEVLSTRSRKPLPKAMRAD
jgi:outer membrane protein TolC